MEGYKLREISSIDESAAMYKQRARSNSKNVSKKPDGSLRVKLPALDSYQQILKFPAEAPARVILRLERLMGSSKVRPVDPNYMKTLRGKLFEDEATKWKSRISKRRKTEEDRCRKLVINGFSNPLSGMEDLYKHPVFRVNRILQRLANVDRGVTHQWDSKPRPIKPVEPFETYRETGYLFGFHENHYSKTQPSQRQVKFSDGGETRPMSQEMKTIYQIPEFDEDGKLITSKANSLPSIEEQIHLKPILKTSSSLIQPTEDTSLISDQLQPESPSESFLQLKQNFDFDSGETIEEAKRRLGINTQNVEDIWKKYESPLIKLLDTPQGKSSLFDTSESIREVLKREDRFSTEVMNETYRKSFQRDSNETKT